jgi:HEAT repeat protein
VSSLEYLLADLRSENEARAEAAAAELAQLGEEAIKPLESLLQSSVVDQRWWAVRTLAQMQEPPLEWLILSLGDPSDEVREAAALALVLHPTEKAIPSLIGVLSDANAGMLGTLTANALTTIGKAAVPGLLEAYENARPQARIQIMRCLAEIRDHRAISLMLKATEDDSAMLSYWAKEGLEGLGLNMVYIKPD